MPAEVKINQSTEITLFEKMFWKKLTLQSI